MRYWNKSNMTLRYLHEINSSLLLVKKKHIISLDCARDDLPNYFSYNAAAASTFRWPSSHAGSSSRKREMGCRQRDKLHKMRRRQFTRLLSPLLYVLLTVRVSRQWNKKERALPLPSIVFLHGTNYFHLTWWKEGRKKGRRSVAGDSRQIYIRTAHRVQSRPQALFMPSG